MFKEEYSFWKDVANELGLKLESLEPNPRMMPWFKADKEYFTIMMWSGIMYRKISIKFKDPIPQDALKNLNFYTYVIDQNNLVHYITRYVKDKQEAIKFCRETCTIMSAGF